MEERTQIIGRLLRNIREEVIGILFNRYVFRTHQEIVRLNPRLQGRPQSIFSEWAWIVYAGTNGPAVRRLASQSYEDGDVNLVKLLDMLIRDSGQLWSCFELHFSADVAKVRADALKGGQEPSPDWAHSACRRLISEDRKMLITVTEKTNRFVNKRVAHSAPDCEVSTKFSDLDAAIDLLKELTEKYTLLFSSALRLSLEVAHRAGAPTDYLMLAQLGKRDLLDEMKSRKLPKGWDSVFLEPWATRETIALPLGEMSPPLAAHR